MLYGKVESISGRTVKISNNGDVVSVAILENAIFSAVDASKKSPVRQGAKFEDIKVGDNLNISVKVAENNSFIGASVVIFLAQK